MDFLNFIATSALAIAAVAIAFRANEIAGRSVRVEADKLVLEWAQRCLHCLSNASSLRLISDGQIEDDEFREQRRSLRAELFALKEEGALFFHKGQGEVLEPALAALDATTKCMDGRRFEPPKPGDYDAVRKVQNLEIRSQTRSFIQSVQARVGNEWLAD